MADSYWLSFRLRDSDGYEGTYNDRLTDLTEEIRAACGAGGNWWYETTSFFIFTSDETIDTIVYRVKRAIDVDVDLVVIGKPDYKTGRVVGCLADPDILSIIPFMKKV